MKVSEEDYNSLEYFHFDKGDVTRWVGWDEFAEKHPHVKLAYEQMINQQKIFESVLKGLEHDLG